MKELKPGQRVERQTCFHGGVQIGDKGTVIKLKIDENMTDHYLIKWDKGIENFHGHYVDNLIVIDEIIEHDESLPILKY